MSRAPAGSFADFFPNAPSVLQQKRKRHAQDNQNRGHDASGRSAQQTPPSSNGVHVQSSCDPVHEDGNGHERERASKHSSPGDGEILKVDAGDLLNGVGSASSLASTASSVFSSNNTSAMAAYPGASSESHALTPITNTESSPPGKAPSPRPAKMYPGAMRPDHSHRHDSREPQRHTVSEAMTPVQTPPRARKNPRPGPGEVKGFKAIYDPELDPKLSGKEKKKHKTRYRIFGEEVSVARQRRFVCFGTPADNMHRMINLLRQILGSPLQGTAPACTHPKETPAKPRCG